MPIIQDRILELHAPCASGETLVLKRCGAFPDLFASPDGRLFRLYEPEQTVLSGHPIIRYEGSNLMARHLMADAFSPGWDEDLNVQIASKDGDPTNTAWSNIELRPMRTRGRPRDGLIMRQLKVIELLLYCHDVDIVMEELKLTREQVITSLVRWAPWMLKTSYQPKIEGLPESFDRIGASRKLKRMAKRGELG